MKNIAYLTLLFVLSTALANSQQVVLGLVASGLASPTDIKNAGDKRLFIVQREGTILIIDTSGTLKPLPFLNISARVLANSEQGLLGLAFDPGYRNNGFFYVDYTRKPDGAT